MRQRRAIPCDEVRELDTHTEDDDSSRMRSFGLRDALATLPEEQRQVVVMRHLVGLTPGEIADRLGRTEPSIHGLHHRGRGALRTALSEMDCAPTIAGKVAA
jgi:RNA polymerase sigma-70 factor (ECF subfamily)